MARFVLSAFADEAGSSIDEQIAALRENEIDYIEPRNIGGKGILELSDEEILEVKKKLDDAGIKVGSLGSPIGKYPIDGEFAPHFEKTKRAVEICKLLETKNIRMFSFFTSQDKLAEVKDEVISRLREMVAYGKKNGIRFCHENESAIYGQMPAEVKELLTEIPDMYGIFDAANYRMNGADVDAGIDATLTRLAYLHIKDAIYGEQMIVPAGEGEGKIAEVLNKVNDATDEVIYLTLEPHLKLFDAYKDIDEHELKNKYVFKTNREAFDFAANALKKLLKENGYERNGNNEWIR
ncbi:MAG: sugar phosphate isomerase/epimerase [Clostridia bacterium]|nr:sugar phosphate isomerase/epimerase [Clostridia bacterium]